MLHRLVHHALFACSRLHPFAIDDTEMTQLQISTRTYSHLLFTSLDKFGALGHVSSSDPLAGGI